MIDCSYLIKVFSDYEIHVDNDQANQFDKYAEKLVETNKVMNLTAITEPTEIIHKHFLDSALLLKSIGNETVNTLIDVGTGAGFPGIPSKILRPDIKLTLIDSLGKRVSFLKDVSDSLGFGADCVHSRAEDLGQNPKYREKYDVATARAVSKLPELCEYCIPYVRVGGLFVAMKGSDIDEEVKASEGALKTLGAKIIDIKKYTLPDGSLRNIILIRKIKSTDKQYPRPHAKMVKKPL